MFNTSAAWKPFIVYKKHFSNIFIPLIIAQLILQAVYWDTYYSNQYNPGENSQGIYMFMRKESSKFKNI